MSRHPLDHQQANTRVRPQQFDAVAQGERPSPASKELQRRTRTTGTARLTQFARIERSGTADA